MRNKQIFALMLLLGLFYSTIFSVNATQVTSIYYKLFYDGFDVNGNPTFICQNCKLKFIDMKVSTAKATLKPSLTDINVLVAFKCPNCGAEYRLFVALHRFSATNIAICIQKSTEEGAGGIPSKWWNVTASLKP